MRWLTPILSSDPSCTGTDHDALLKRLPTADYFCTESISQALAPLASTTTIDRLVSMAAGATCLERRNSLRTLGNFAHRADGDPARSLVRETAAASVQKVLLDRLQHEREAAPLIEAIWVTDSVFHPLDAAQPLLELIVSNQGFDERVRWRAANAIGRLLVAKPGLLPADDLDLVLTLLSSDELWVRAEFAFVCWVLGDTQLDGAARRRLVNELEERWTQEGEWIPKAYLAGALDRYTGTSRRAEVRRAMEHAMLGQTMDGINVVLRSGLPASELPELLEHTAKVRAAFFDLLGDGFQTALPDDPNPVLLLSVFATKDDYFTYTTCFLPSVSFAGGVYLEGQGELLTYQRTPTESTYTLKELLAHKFGHYLQGRYVYPGLFSDPGYHAEPKGWADEGLSQLLGGTRYNNGSYELPLWRNQLNVVCPTRPLRALADLLARRMGYSEAGVFDYEFAWALLQYLMTRQREAGRHLYAAFRAESYRLNRFAEIVGVGSLAEMERDWHAAIETWCASSDKGGPEQPPRYWVIVQPSPQKIDGLSPRPGRREAPLPPNYQATQVVIRVVPAARDHGVSRSDG